MTYLIILHAGLVYDITDTDRRAQNGSTYGCVFCIPLTRQENKEKQTNKTSETCFVRIV